MPVHRSRRLHRTLQGGIGGFTPAFLELTRAGVDRTLHIARSALDGVLHLAELVKLHRAIDLGLDVVHITLGLASNVPTVRATRGSFSGPMTIKATAPISAILEMPRSIMKGSVH